MTAEHHQKSYQGILKSAALLGSARVLTLVVGLARMKFLAVLIGPAGVGLIGTFDVLIMMAIYVFGLGVHSSGVRQIAVAVGNNEQDRAAHSVFTLRRLAWSLGLIGTVILAVLARPVSLVSFEEANETSAILILSPAILFSSIYYGGLAILQGHQRIGALAKMSVVSAVGQAFITVAFVYIWGRDGIAPSFVVGTAFSVAVSYRYTRDIVLPNGTPPWRDTLSESRAFIKLGLGLTNALLLSTLVTYAVRSLIARNLGLEAVGIYLCAYSLSGKFIGFLLDAMQTDFYPRLSAAANDDRSLNQLVNQQTEIVLLMAIPGLLVTLASAPWVVRLLYSREFDGSTVLLRWFILGCLARVIWAPIGFIQLAKGKSLLYFLSESVINLTTLAATFALIKFYGLQGAAASYLVGNIIQIVVLLGISMRLTGFAWSSESVRFLSLFVVISVACVAASFVLGNIQAAALIGCVAVVTSYYCVRQLANRLGPDHRLSRMAAMLPLYTRLYQIE